MNPTHFARHGHMSNGAVMHKRQLGLTMIELLVAMLIGLFLIAGTVTVYLQSGSTYRTSDKIARLQEVGRYALDIVENDVRLAGMWNNMMYMPGGGGNITNTINPAKIDPNCGANWVGDVGNYIEGRDAGAVLTADPGCTASSTATASDASDAIVIRRVAIANPAPAVDTNKIQFQSTRMAGTIFSGAAIPSEYDPAKSLTSDLIVRAYYVVQTAADKPFVLRRRTLSGTSGAWKFNEEDVIAGVQDFQVQFGVDTDNDNQADQYVNPGATAGRRIVSARIWILVVSEDSEMDLNDSTVYAYANRNYGAAFTDKKRRVLLTKTIQIRNARLL